MTKYRLDIYTDAAEDACITLTADAESTIDKAIADLESNRNVTHFSSGTLFSYETTVVAAHVTHWTKMVRL